jgi:prepilin-type processing-associated H-X9-DG protein
LRSTLCPTLSPNGVFYNQSKVRIADITDGTSNTAMFSEHLRGGLTPNKAGTNLLLSVPNTTTLMDTNQMCQSADPTMAMPMCFDTGASWAMGEMCCTLYNHVSTPNTLSCGGMGFPGGMVNMAMDMPPTSGHNHGVNVLFCDGSVHFIDDAITLQTWWALGTRNGNDIIGPDFMP